MKNSGLLLALIALLASVFVPAAQAVNEALPLCQEAYCQKIFHDKKLEQATVIVWNGKGDILSTYSFHLDRSAKLVNPDVNASETGQEIMPLGAATPPSGCGQTGACDITTSYTYETATSMVTVITIFQYYNGVLVSVSTTSKETKKPDDTRQEQ